VLHGPFILQPRACKKKHTHKKAQTLDILVEFSTEYRHRGPCSISVFITLGSTSDMCYFKCL